MSEGNFGDFYLKLHIEDGYHICFSILCFILQNGTTHKLSLKLVRKFIVAHGLLQMWIDKEKSSILFSSDHAERDFSTPVT